MASPLVQKARQQKMIYFGAIVALFTLSLVHREFIINEQAIRLQLKETVRGEVELTSSAVRLMLTGSRGLAVTMLWYNAMEKQKRNEWHDLELLVKSITKLQPYFITPWLYQGWNISFNVAVECDRPRDKYYYISRGLELLAEGERRNRGTDSDVAAADTDRVVFPGNPELRHFMGFTYQLKIGSSDERLTMRSLLELSCIDPLQRNPDKFETKDERTGRQTVNFAELSKFYQRNPRLARRLHEQLGLADKQFVQFLRDHQKIPNRFKAIDKTENLQIEVSELKDPQEQFPILPPHEGNWPDPRTPQLTNEAIDVFLVSRTWYEFAMKPLPPPDPTPRDHTPSFNKLRYRLPKQMVTQIFRNYVARAQVFIAETLEQEGFFDADGWSPDKALRAKLVQRGAAPGDVVFGTDAKYHSRLAWKRGHDLYRKYGTENGMYLSPGEMDELTKQAELAFKKFNIKLGEPVPARSGGTDELGKSIDAAVRLYFNAYYRRLTNFDTYFYQSEAESDLFTIAARKLLFTAERKYKREAPSKPLLDLYRDAWDLYLLACFKYPRFGQVSSVQEDVYEMYHHYLQYTRLNYHEDFKKRMSLAAKLPMPHTWLDALAAFHVVSKVEEDPQAYGFGVAKVLKRLRYHQGELDRIQYLDVPNVHQRKEIMFEFLHGAGTSCGIRTVYFPGLEYTLWTRSTPFPEETPPNNWTPIFTPETRSTAADRLNLPR